MPMIWSKLLDPNRRRQTTLPTDFRAQFERDYGRAIFSTPVKRLQDKAQVFPLEAHDAVRTRLTHSLEVSSVARSLATEVAKRLLDEGRIDAGMDRHIESIAAVCGLIHDIGNPPFGHSGEDAIREWFSKAIGREDLAKRLDGNEQLVQDFLQFEGNAQTLRLVAKLQILADDKGLNLTFGTLSAACKYVAPSHQLVKAGDQAKKKPGYFASERDLVKEVREKTGTGDSRNPITYLVEAADDIVYSVADIEDGIKKGILSWDDLKRELEDRAKELQIESVLARVLDIKAKILNADKAEGHPKLPDDVHGSAFRTAAIAELVPDAVKTFFNHYDQIMEGTFTSDLVSEGSTAGFIKACKQIGVSKIYNTSQTLKLELMGRRIIFDLMDVFWKGAHSLAPDGTSGKGFDGKLGALLSESYKRVFANTLSAGGHLPEDYHRFQLLTDYVCGMTDTFARTLHKELTNG
jgi:dGTPase